MVRHIPRLLDEENLLELVKSILVGINVSGISERVSIREDLMNDMECLLVFHGDTKSQGGDAMSGGDACPFGGV